LKSGVRRITANLIAQEYIQPLHRHKNSEHRQPSSRENCGGSRNLTPCKKNIVNGSNHPAVQEKGVARDMIRNPRSGES
jgi:hypothetical protein